MPPAVAVSPTAPPAGAPPIRTPLKPLPGSAHPAPAGPLTSNPNREALHGPQIIPQGRPHAHTAGRFLLRPGLHGVGHPPARWACRSPPTWASPPEGPDGNHPVLAGALLRIVMGVLVDHLKPKLAGRHRPGHRDRCPLRGLEFGIQLHRRCSPWASSPGLPGPPSRWRCRWPRAGIRRAPGHHAGHRRRRQLRHRLTALFGPGLAAAFGWAMCSAWR